MIEAAILVIFPFCMAHAAVSDGLTMTIANRVSILLVASFLLLAPLTGMDWSAYGMHLMAGGVVLLVTFSLFAFGAMGGGDAKLLAATALWMGWSVTLLQYLIYAALLGGMLTLPRVLPCVAACRRGRPVSFHAPHHRRQDRHSLRHRAGRGRFHDVHRNRAGRLGNGAAGRPLTTAAARETALGEQIKARRKRVTVS